MLDNHDQPSVDANNRNNGGDNDRKWRRAEVALAAVIAVATVVQAGTSWYQWRATQDQYTVMREQLTAMERDQQSWVSVTPPKMKGKQGATDEIKFSYAFRNMGRNPVIVHAKGFGVHVITSGIPADSMFGTLKIDIGDDGHIAGVPEVRLQTEAIAMNIHAYGEMVDCKTTIDPGSAIEIERAWKPEKPLAQGEFPVFVFAAYYQDISGHSHIARGGFVYIPSEKRFLRDPKGDNLW
jgi:hypothetical protein